MHCHLRMSLIADVVVDFHSKWRVIFSSTKKFCRSWLSNSRLLTPVRRAIFWNLKRWRQLDHGEENDGIAFGNFECRNVVMYLQYYFMTTSDFSSLIFFVFFCIHSISECSFLACFHCSSLISVVLYLHSFYSNFFCFVFAFVLFFVFTSFLILVFLLQWHSTMKQRKAKGSKSSFNVSSKIQNLHSS